PLITDDNGIVYFGPSSGFTMQELDLSKGVETPFKAKIVTPGEYTLTVELVEAATDKRIGNAGVVEFIAQAAKIEGKEPNSEVGIIDEGDEGWTRFAGSVDVA